ncbi:DnaD domain protein [Paenibacillus taichungensis]|uniref:DnaD domain protein n=1 Tax=Paenibacillus taichungensis TaxID=484184 RepID=A0ABX2MJZ4_9BACL|nr:DnaD domain protein [Paenibacillus taichungensis]NUU54358.1 DnaD domain protein [Paenibacillus taichungensis]
MADRRMISKIISVSEKVNKLPDIFDMLLFTWMIPHTDDFGRLPGSPFKVKNLVVPSIKRIDEPEIEVALEHLQAAGLIHWYKVGEDRVVQIVNFEEHQQGLHKRTKSKFPDPPSDDSETFPEVPGSSEDAPKIPSELNRTEGKGTEENRSEEKRKQQEKKEEILSDDDPLFQPLGTKIDSSSCNKPDINLFDIFQREGFGTISPFTSDEIQTLEKDYGARWVQEAMKVAVLNGIRKLSYVDGILVRWKANGIDEPWTKEAQPSNGSGNGGNKYNKRSGKPNIEVVQPVTDPEQSGITDEEYEEMMRYAAELQANKQQEVPH